MCSFCQITIIGNLKHAAWFIPWPSCWFSPASPCATWLPRTSTDQQNWLWPPRASSRSERRSQLNWRHVCIQIVQINRILQVTFLLADWVLNAVVSTLVWMWICDCFQEDFKSMEEVLSDADVLYMIRIHTERFGSKEDLKATTHYSSSDCTLSLHYKVDRYFCI